MKKKEKKYLQQTIPVKDSLQLSRDMCAGIAKMTYCAF